MPQKGVISETSKKLGFNAAQDRFLKELTRQQLASWCTCALQESNWANHYWSGKDPCYLYAVERKWIGASGQITAAGFDVAAAFLRR